MLDKTSSYILSSLLGYCLEVGVYVVLESEEVIKNSPTSFNLTKEKLIDSIKLLSGLGYVNLKYVSSEEFCISVTNSGKNYLNDLKNQRRTKISLNLKIFSICFLGGFLGGVLGGLIAIFLG